MAEHESSSDSHTLESIRAILVGDELRNLRTRLDRLEETVGTLATELRSKMDHQVDTLKAEVDTKAQRTHDDVSGVEASIQQLRSDVDSRFGELTTSQSALIDQVKGQLERLAEASTDRGELADSLRRLADRLARK